MGTSTELSAGSTPTKRQKIIEVCITALGGTDRAELSSKLAVGQNSPTEKL